jgi:site-specific recombinase XerD
VAEYKAPSIHIRKSRGWTLRQIYHFLALQRHVPQNIALKLPYPIIEKTVPQFLTADEYKGQVFSNYLLLSLLINIFFEMFTVLMYTV